MSRTTQAASVLAVTRIASNEGTTITEGLKGGSRARIVDSRIENRVPRIINSSSRPKTATAGGMNAHYSS
jgi:hypothetical protein